MLHRLAPLSLLLVLAAGCSSAKGWQPAFHASPNEPDVGNTQRLETPWLLNVWGLNADDVWAVGGLREPADGGVILRYDGSTWSEVDVGFGVPLMNWITGFGPDDVTAVGNDGTVIHWDGASWTRQDTPTDEQLWGVWGSAPDELWAVGGSGRSGSLPTLLSYDGVEWTAATIPDLGERVRALFKVWGAAANDVWVVGARGTLLHYDGATWEQVMLDGVAQDLIAVWGSDADHVVVVGGRGNGVVAAWDGTEWRSRDLANDATPGLNGVWMGSPTTAHVVGNADALGGVLGTIDFSTLELTEAGPDVLLGDRRDFHAIHGVDGMLFAVGGNLSNTAEPEVGIAWCRELGDDE